LGPNAQIFDECRANEGCTGEGSFTNPFAAENRVVAPASALGSSYLSLNTYCGSFVKEAPCPTNEGGAITYDALIELFAADLTLSQPVGPTVSDVAGGLAEDPGVSGVGDVSFHATDPGSGVYEALVEVDGEVVEHSILDEEGGRCRSLGGTSDGLNAFLYTRPCPAEASADLPLDTTGLANGPHHLLVTVTDAAGNAATVLNREITVANPLPPIGSARSACAASVATRTPEDTGPVLTARWRGHRGPRLRARYGPAHTIEGTLVVASAGGAPIAGAGLEVCELPAYRGASAALLGAPHTDADGRWSLALPTDLPSATLRVIYRANPLEARPAAQRELTLTVPAALWLRIAPRATRSTGAIRLSGRLLGASLPPGGKQLVLEARSPGGPWIEFHVIRTGARGRFSYLYRFRLAGPAHYQFRVLCEAEADFPFATGTSNVVGVFER
jgi:hypothetical protein